MATGYTKNETLLKVDNFSKSFGEGKDKKVILRDINLEVKDIVRPNMTQGQVVSILAKSGMGKTVLLRALSGLDDLSKGASGQILINKGNALEKVKEGDMGLVYQNYPLFENLTVYENLKLGFDFRALKVSVSNVREVIEGYADNFDLLPHLKKYPIQLSGGQRQRTSIVQQLLNGSYFLLLDEPFSGLDCIMIDKVTKLLRKVSLSNELQTLIIVSHDLENAVALCDTVFVLGNEEGKEGAIIKKEIDLIERGLSWQEDIKDNPIFRDTIREIKSLL